MEKILVNSDNYNGLYVALKSPDDTTIVGSGKTPEDAIKDAEKKNINNPFILYVPDEEAVHIYYVS